MHLFDNIERHYEGPAKYSESAFSYLNRSARPAAARVRDLLRSWFSHYPVSERAELRARLRSQDDPHHFAAFFELFLHELLLRLGCKIHIHPDVEDDTTRRPDFQAISPNGERFYIEAVLATDESEEDAAAQARMNVVYDALNQLNSPNFFVGMDLEGAPDTPPSAKSMRAFLRRRLSKLDPDEIASRWEIGGLELVPRWPYHHDGWDIVFFPIPKSPEARGKPGIRPIGTQFHGFRIVVPEEAIKTAILKKAGRYGELEIPYIIAVNAMSKAGVDRIDIMEALFGKEQIVVTAPTAANDPMKPRFKRKPNGVWTSETGPRYTRVSAVLLAAPILPWNIARATLCLYHNPWAAKAYASALTRLPQAVLQKNDRMSWINGAGPAEIFGLSTDWPEG